MKRDLREPQALLRNLCFLNKLPAAALSEMAEQCVRKSVPKGRFLFFEGEPLNKIYFVKEGGVLLLRQSLDGEESVFQIVLKNGAVAAVESLTSTAYPYSAKALEDTRLFALPSRTFQKTARSHSMLFEEALKCANVKLSGLSSAQHALMKERAEVRLAKLLVALDESERKNGRSKGFMLPNSQSIADAIGVTHETALRILSKLRKEKIMQQQNSRITLDRQMLALHLPEARFPAACLICAGL